MGINYSPKIVNRGLVLYLDAANPRSYLGSGTTWSDLSKNNLNASLANGATYDSSDIGSMLFDGNDDYAGVGYGTGLFASAVDKTEITIDTFVKLNASNAYQVFFQIGGYINSVVLGCLNNNKARFLVRKDGNSVGGANDRYVDSTTVLTTGTWYHIVGSKTASTMKIFVNGVEEASLSTTFTWNTGGDTPVWVGRNNSQSSLTGTNNQIDALNGNVSLLRVHDVGISGPEISQNFNATRGRYGI